MTVHLVTDSNSQLPDDLAASYDITVVPIVVLMDGVERREGTELNADDFYRELATTSEVSTSQPSPGEFVAAYAQAIADGANEIVSIHVGSELSGTLNSERLASEAVDVAVWFVDTGLTSFSVSCAVLEAAEALASGADAAGCVAAAEAVCPNVLNAFVMGGLDLARASGRVTIGAEVEAALAAGVPVMAFAGGELDILGNAVDLAYAAEMMKSVILATPGRLRVGVGVADRSVFGFYEQLEERLAAADRSVELIRYRCGPSVGAFTGAGTAGACWYSLRD